MMFSVRTATSPKVTGLKRPIRCIHPAGLGLLHSRYLENSTAWFLARNHTLVPIAHPIKRSCCKSIIYPQQEKLPVIFVKYKKISFVLPFSSIPFVKGEKLSKILEP